MAPKARPLFELNGLERRYKLKPCPVCGSKATINKEGNEYVARCSNTSCSQESISSLTADGAAQKWGEINS